MPNIFNFLNQLGKCHYVSTLDLASRFQPIEIDPKDTPKTVFSEESTHYEFAPVPFGLRNVPSIFKRVVDNILFCMQNEHCVVYMENIIISKIHEHISRLTEIFRSLQNKNLKIHSDRCMFLLKEITI